MIKTGIIFILLILLCGGAFLSRPTRQNFEAYIHDESKVTDSSLASKLFSNWKADAYLESITFKDRYLWVEVEHEGKTQFVGVFSKFFNVISDKPAEPAKTEPAKSSAAEPAKKDDHKFPGGD